MEYSCQISRLCVMNDIHKHVMSILADLHECDQHIHLILLVEVLTNTKQHRNLYPKTFPTFNKKWASATGLSGLHAVSRKANGGLSHSI